MYFTDKVWSGRLYQAKYQAKGLGLENLFTKLDTLEMKYHLHKMEEEDWLLLNDIEDEIDNYVKM